MLKTLPSYLCLLSHIVWFRKCLVHLPSPSGIALSSLKMSVEKSVLFCSFFLLSLPISLGDVYWKVVVWLLLCLKPNFLISWIYLHLQYQFLKYFCAGQSNFLAYYHFKFSSFFGYFHILYCFFLVIFLFLIYLFFISDHFFFDLQNYVPIIHFCNILFSPWRLYLSYEWWQFLYI